MTEKDNKLPVNFQKWGETTVTVTIWESIKLRFNQSLSLGWRDKSTKWGKSVPSIIELLCTINHKNYKIKIA